MTTQEECDYADKLAAARAMLVALKEIETICNEDNAACRRRMGTRAGNSLVTARAAIAQAKAAGVK
jgi:hypothetical protein